MIIITKKLPNWSFVMSIMQLWIFNVFRIIKPYKFDANVHYLLTILSESVWSWGWTMLDFIDISAHTQWEQVYLINSWSFFFFYRILFLRTTIFVLLSYVCFSCIQAIWFVRRQYWRGPLTFTKPVAYFVMTSSPKPKLFYSASLSAFSLCSNVPF